MITHRVSAATICRTIGITPKTMSCKVNEKSQFTRTEMYRIHDYFFKDEDFYELFKSDKQSESESGTSTLLPFKKYLFFALLYFFLV